MFLMISLKSLVRFKVFYGFSRVLVCELLVIFDTFGLTLKGLPKRNYIFNCFMCSGILEGKSMEKGVGEKGMHDL